MEGGSHGSSLPDGDRITAFRGDDFDAISYVLYFRGSDEDHFQRPFPDRGVVRITTLGLRYEFAFADGAVDLSSVGIAADADVKGAEPGLRRVFYFSGEQD